MCERCDPADGVRARTAPRLRPTRRAWVLMWVTGVLLLAWALSALADAIVPVP